MHRTISIDIFNAKENCIFEKKNEIKSTDTRTCRTHTTCGMFQPIIKSDIESADWFTAVQIVSLSKNISWKRIFVRKNLTTNPIT